MVLQNLVGICSSVTRRLEEVEGTLSDMSHSASANDESQPPDRQSTSIEDQLVGEGTKEGEEAPPSQTGEGEGSRTQPDTPNDSGTLGSDTVKLQVSQRALLQLTTEVSAIVSEVANMSTQLLQLSRPTAAELEGGSGHSASHSPHEVQTLLLANNGNAAATGGEAGASNHSLIGSGSPELGLSARGEGGASTVVSKPTSPEPGADAHRRRSVTFDNEQMADPKPSSVALSARSDIPLPTGSDGGEESPRGLEPGGRSGSLRFGRLDVMPPVALERSNAASPSQQSQQHNEDIALEDVEGARVVQRTFSAVSSFRFPSLAQANPLGGLGGGGDFLSVDDLSYSGGANRTRAISIVSLGFDEDEDEGSGSNASPTLGIKEAHIEPVAPLPEEEKPAKRAQSFRDLLGGRRAQQQHNLPSHFTLNGRRTTEPYFTQDEFNKIMGEILAIYKDEFCANVWPFAIAQKVNDGNFDVLQYVAELADTPTGQQQQQASANSSHSRLPRMSSMSSNSTNRSRRGLGGNAPVHRTTSGASITSDLPNNHNDDNDDSQQQQHQQELRTDLDPVKHAFTSVVLSIFLQYRFISSFGFQVGKFVQFLDKIYDFYAQRNPFHNALRAADLLHGAHTVLSQANVKNNLTDLELFGTLFASLTLHLGHLGVDNDFLRRTDHPLSRLYVNNPMESSSAALVTALLSNREFNFFDQKIWNATDKLGVGVANSLVITEFITDIITGCAHKNHLVLLNDACDIFQAGAAELAKEQKGLGSGGNSARAASGTKPSLPAPAQVDNRRESLAPFASLTINGEQSSGLLGAAGTLQAPLSVSREHSGDPVPLDISAHPEHKPSPFQLSITTPMTVVDRSVPSALRIADFPKILKSVVHLVDVRHTMKPAAAFSDWIGLWLDESTLQGDEEMARGMTISYHCRRNADPVDYLERFMRSVVWPLVEVLHAVVPKSWKAGLSANLRALQIPVDDEGSVAAIRPYRLAAQRRASPKRLSTSAPSSARDLCLQNDMIPPQRWVDESKGLFDGLRAALARDSADHAWLTKGSMDIDGPHLVSMLGLMNSYLAKATSLTETIPLGAASTGASLAMLDGFSAELVAVAHRLNPLYLGISLQQPSPQSPTVGNGIPEGPISFDGRKNKRKGDRDEQSPLSVDEYNSVAQLLASSTIKPSSTSAYGGVGGTDEPNPSIVLMLRLWERLKSFVANFHEGASSSLASRPVASYRKPISGHVNLTDTSFQSMKNDNDPNHSMNANDTSGASSMPPLQSPSPPPPVSPGRSRWMGGKPYDLPPVYRQARSQ